MVSWLLLFPPGNFALWIWSVNVGDAKGDTLAMFNLNKNSIHIESPRGLKFKLTQFFLCEKCRGKKDDRTHSLNLSVVVWYFLNPWSIRKNESESENETWRHGNIGVLLTFGWEQLKIMFLCYCFRKGSRWDLHSFIQQILLDHPQAFTEIATEDIKNIKPESLHSTASVPVQLLSHVRLFATPWTAAHKTSLSITNS